MEQIELAELQEQTKQAEQSIYIRGAMEQTELAELQEQTKQAEQSIYICQTIGANRSRWRREELTEHTEPSEEQTKPRGANGIEQMEPYIYAKEEEQTEDIRARGAI